MGEYYTTTTTTTTTTTAYSKNIIAAIENYTQHSNHQYNLQNFIVAEIVVAMVVEVVCNQTNQLTLTSNSSMSSLYFLSYMKTNAIDFLGLNYRMVVGISFESSQTNEYLKIGRIRKFKFITDDA